MPRPFLQAVLAVALAALGLAVARWVLLTAPEPAAAPPRAPRPVPVAALRVARAPLALEVVMEGLVAPARRVTVAAERAGRVSEVLPGWRSGVSVARGALLVRLDARDARLALAAAEVRQGLAASESRRAADDEVRAAAAAALAAERLAALVREEQRWERLAAEGRAEASRLDAAAATRLSAALDEEAARARVLAARAAAERAALEQRAAEVAAEAARLELERTELRAPCDGTLVGDAPAVGAFVAPGAALGELLAAGPTRLDVHLAEDDAALVRVGDPAQVLRLAGLEVDAAARVAAVAPVAEALARSVRVELELAAAAGERPPPAGATGRARVPLGAPLQAVWLPRDALVLEADGPAAFVLCPCPPAGADAPAEDGATHVAVRRPVVLGRAHAGGHVVTAGLDEGELVAVSAVRLLGEGARVVLQEGPGR